MPDDGRNARTRVLGSTRLRRALTWLHVGYLCLLPPLAILAAAAVTQRAPIGTYLCGFVPGVVFAAAILSSYRAPASVATALALVVAVPAQIALGVIAFDAGPWAFVVEAALVEVGALALGIGVAMVVHRPTGALGAGVGAGLIAGASLAYLPSVLRAYDGAHSAWYVLFVTAFATAAVFHVQRFSVAAAEFLSSGLPQDVELEYGTGRVARFLGLGGRRDTVGIDIGDDTLLVAILVWVGVYVLGGIVVCAAANARFDD